MDKKIKIAIGGIIVVIVIAITTYTISPLFINTTLDEPLPDTRTNIGFDEYMKLSEDDFNCNSWIDQLKVLFKVFYHPSLISSLFVYVKILKLEMIILI